MKKYCIYGTGGFGREVLCLVKDILSQENKSIDDQVVFLVDDEFFDEDIIMGIPVIKKSHFNADDYNVTVAVGNPHFRKKIVDSMPKSTTYNTLIHPNCIISDWIKIGEGTIITAGCILTCNIEIGKHCHFNLNTTIGHDCIIGNFVTSAPAVNISGSCILGDEISLGTNSVIREKISICNDVTIGMGGIVVKSINEPGTYIGNPLKKLR